MYFWSSAVKNIALDLKEETHNGFIYTLLHVSLLFRFISGLQLPFRSEAKSLFSTASVKYSHSAFHTWIGCNCCFMFFFSTGLRDKY